MNVTITAREVRITVAFIWMMLSTYAANANLLVNGSFESGPGSDDGHSVGPLLPGDTSITGWVVERGGIDYVGTSTWWQVADGIYALDLNGSSGPGGIMQTFATVSGQVYSVTFNMAGNPSWQAVMTMTVQAAGQSNSFSFSTIGHNRFNNMGWTENNWNFTAVDSQTTLEFFSTFTGSAYEGPALDKVSVDVVPEPSACLLTMLGMLAAVTNGNIARLRRKSR